MKKDQAQIEKENMGIYERERKIVPDCVKPNDGEIPVKQYNIAVLRTRIKFMRAEGRMQVTNKRLLFRATGRSLTGRTFLQHEFSLTDIAGIEIRKDWRISLFNFFGAILLAWLVGGILVSIAMGAGFLFALISYMASGGTLKTGADLIVGFGGPILDSKIPQIIYKISIAGILMGVILFFVGISRFFGSKKRSLKTSNTLGAACGALMGSYIYGSNWSFGGDGYNWNQLISPVLVILSVFVFVLCIISIFLISFVPNLVIMVKTKSASGAIEVCRNTGAAFFVTMLGDSDAVKGEFTSYREVMPWKETDLAIKELGAMINDLQTGGDYMIAKWKKD